MEAVEKILVFAVILNLLAGVSSSKYEDYLDDDDEDVCRLVTLRSTKTTKDKIEIKDEYGSPADISLVKVINQLSSVRCVRGDTYVVSDSTLTAKKGCCAKFKVCYSSNGYYNKYGNKNVRPGCEVVRLLSRLNRKVRKELDFEVSSMKVLHQFDEGTTCRRRENFGYRGRVVHADGGCRADFEVCFNDDDDGYRHEKYCQKVVLESWGPGEPDSKRITNRNGRKAHIKSIELLNQRSKARCVKGRTFFVTGNKVKATNGCQGVFRVCVV